MKKTHEQNDPGKKFPFDHLRKSGDSRMSNLWVEKFLKKPCRDRVSKCLVALILLFVAASSTSQPPLQPEKCYQVHLTKNLRWATTGTWSTQGDSLWVVDSFMSQVVKITLRGDVLTDAMMTSYQIPESSTRMPTQIRMTENGFLVEEEAKDHLNDSDVIHSFDNSPGTRNRSFEVQSLNLGEARLWELYDWTPLGEGFLAFADLSVTHGPGQEVQYKSAFLYFEESGYYQIHDTVPIDSPLIINQYTGLTPYLATLDSETAYILFLDARPRIGEVKARAEGVRELKYFPEDFRSRPSPPQEKAVRHGFDQAIIRYRLFEKSKMASALYVLNDHLFLLGKDAMNENDETSWRLIEIDPRNGAELSRFVLPTTAAHLTVVPGKEYWALIEKEKVESVGDTIIRAPYMRTSSMKLVPSIWLESPDQGPLVTDSDLRCNSLFP